MYYMYYNNKERFKDKKKRYVNLRYFFRNAFIIYYKSLQKLKHLGKGS